MPQMLAQYRRGEWHCRHSHEQQQIQDHQRVVRALDVVEQAMMVDPHDADKSEANNERHVSRPLPQQQRRQRHFADVAFVGDLQLQHQQRDGDGKNAVGKSLDARCLFIHALTGTRNLPENSRESKSYQACLRLRTYFSTINLDFPLARRRKAFDNTRRSSPKNSEPLRPDRRSAHLAYLKTATDGLAKGWAGSRAALLFFLRPAATQESAGPARQAGAARRH